MVLCSSGKEKPSTIQTVKKLYPDEEFTIIWTGIYRGANNKTVTVPINNKNSVENFNQSLARVIGNRKVDLFIFEHCPLGFMNRSSSRANQISNILKKHSKNSTRVITHWAKNWSSRLNYNKTVTVNVSANKNYYIPTSIRRNNNWWNGRSNNVNVYKFKT